MGQENSLPLVDENTPTQTLEARTLEAVGKFITEGNCRRIVVMTGAGISTSAGIPDFRSPETGLYANLARLNLPYAEAVFDISYFRNNPLPFYTLAQELYPGKYRPTITHSFIRLLHDKGLLLKLFTQNIDCLEREAGVPNDKIVEAHGSFARQSCIECRRAYPAELMKEAIKEKKVPRCLDETCKGLVKPEIVFFGEQLPGDFFHNINLPAQADLCIVMGTSLSVAPFSGLPHGVREETPRLLINMEQVGGLGSRADDVVVLGDCDTGVRKLVEACGWTEELEALWARTAPEKAKWREEEMKRLAQRSEEEVLEDEVDRLAKEVEETVKLGEEQNLWLERHVEKKAARIGEDAVPEVTAAAPAMNEVAEKGDVDPDKVLKPVEKEGEEEKTDDGTELGHVFPWQSKKPSL